MLYFLKRQIKKFKNTRQRFVGPLYNTIQHFYTSGSVINFYCSTTKKKQRDPKNQGIQNPLGIVGPA